MEKSVEERIDVLESKIEIIMSMVNHLNEIISNDTISKIELDFKEAVDKTIEELTKK